MLDANEEHVAGCAIPASSINEGRPVQARRRHRDDRGRVRLRADRVKSPLHEVRDPALVARGGIGAFVTLGNG